jgi:hypothetical protein
MQIKVCNALHARWFAEIYFQWFGVALLNLWGVPWADGMLKNEFRVECWLGHVQAFHEQINYTHNIVVIDMCIHGVFSCRCGCRKSAQILALL